MAQPKDVTKRERFNKLILAQTRKYQKIYGFEIDPEKGIHDTHNNEADAFKHVFMQAYLGVRYNNFVSKGVGDWHEFVEGPKSGRYNGENEMDLWNNKIGREIANEVRSEYKKRHLTNDQLYDMIAVRIMKRMRNGELITKPGQKPKIKSNGFDFRKEYTSLEELKKPQNERINKVHEMIRKHEENLKNKKSNTAKHKSSSAGGSGRWITVNGRHVYLER